MDLRERQMRAGNGAPAGLAARIRRREPLVGTVVSVPDAALVELICERFDFVWIDLEHGQLGARDAQVMAIAARASPALLGAVRRVERAAADAQVACGVAAPSATGALAALEAGGSTLFVYSSDVRIYASAVDDAVAGLARMLADREGRRWRD